MAVRPTKVLELVEAANAAMLERAEGTSASEVLSAYFTLAAHAIAVAKLSDVPIETLQSIVYSLLIQCDDTKTRVM